MILSEKEMKAIANTNTNTDTNTDTNTKYFAYYIPKISDDPKAKTRFVHNTAKLRPDFYGLTKEEIDYIKEKRYFDFYIRDKQNCIVLVKYTKINKLFLDEQFKFNRRICYFEEIGRAHV